MAGQAGMGRIFGIHHTQHRASIHNRVASICLVFRMAWILEHPKYFFLEIVRLAVRTPIFDPGQLHTDTGLLIEMISDAADKHGMNKTLESNSLSIDDRLSLVDHLSFCFHQSKI